MQVIDNNYLNGVNFHKNTKPTDNHKTNFDKILPIVNQTLSDQLNEDGNLRSYPNKPALLDTHIIVLSLIQEALSIDSEHWFWSKLQTDYATDFPDLPLLSNYNRRRKHLAGTTEQQARLWGRQLRPHEDAFMVDSIPVPVAHIVREYSTMVCRKQFHTVPDKDYSTAAGQCFIGYKLHVVLTLDGVYHPMELTKASVHDSQYLPEINRRV